MTLSTPIKVVALAGLVCILGALGLLAVAARRQAATTQPAVLPVVHRTATAPKPTKPRLVLSSGLPAPLHRALERSRKVVAVLVSPNIAADAAPLAGARAAAHETRLPVVLLNLSQNAVAAKVATWLPGVGDPAVVIVERPGVAVATLRGWSDAPMVAQVARDTVGAAR